MIAVLGATGTIGRPLIDRLYRQDVAVRALVRNPATAALPVGAVPADLRDPGSLRRGLVGCDRLLLLTPHGPDQDLQEAAAIDAAIDAGVTGIVKLSGGAASVTPNGPTPTAVAHWRSEARIEAAELEFAHLRPPFLMQNLLETVAPIVRRTGLLVGPFSDEPIAMVDADDVAACAAALLTAPDLGRSAHAITGPRSVTHREIADLLGARPVRLPLRMIGVPLRRHGATAWEVDHALRMAAFLRTGAAGQPTDAVLRLTGRRATSIEAFLAHHHGAFSRHPAPSPAAATAAG